MHRPGEPVWLDSDRQLALAWQYERDVLRLPCGHFRDVATGRENADRWSAEPRVCWECEAAGVAAEQRRSTATKADAKHGVFFQLHDHGG